MELRQYLILLRRWAWLLILGLVLGAAGGYLGSIYQTPIYQASTKLLVMRATQERTSEFTYLSDQQLVQTYIQLLTTQSVLDGASQQLNYEINPDQVSVQQIRDTQIIQVTVEDADPQRAAAIANTLVEVLIIQSENLQAGRYAAMESSIQAQITQVQIQITTIQGQIDQQSIQNLEDQKKFVEGQISYLSGEISRLQTEIGQLGSPTTAEEKSQLAEKQAQLAQYQAILGLYQQIYTNLVVYGESAGTDTVGQVSQMQKTLDLYIQIYLQLLGNLESVRLARLQNTPSVTQIEMASASDKPVRPRPVSNTLLAGAVGLFIAIGIAFLIEYLDDTLKTPEDVEQALNLPVIGYIAEMQYSEKSKEEMYVARKPRSPISEAFRSLRTNLEFSAVDRPLQRILVASAGPEEGKTTIAVNLAGVIAQGGKKVILVDADLRRPCVHRFLGIPNRVGLSDLFREQTAIHAVKQNWNGVEGMSVITSGSLPTNPIEILGSEKMGYLLEELKTLADVIVIDCAPSLVADAQALSARVDGVLLVIQPGHTHIDTARAAVEQFNRAGARIVGVVFNRIPRNRGYYYGGYRYFYSYRYRGYKYYSEEGSKTGKSEKRTVEPETRETLPSSAIKSSDQEGG